MGAVLSGNGEGVAGKGPGEAHRGRVQAAGHAGGSSALGFANMGEMGVERRFGEDE